MKNKVAFLSSVTRRMKLGGLGHATTSCCQLLLLAAVITWASLAALTAYAKEKISPTSPTTQQHTVERHGSLYRVQQGNDTIYLFGTIHVGQASFFPLGEEATSAFNQASTVAVEMDVRKLELIQLAVKKYGLYAPGDSIESHLPEDGLQQLKTELAGMGIPFNNVDQMKPWMIANLLITLLLQRAHYLPQDGIDLFLLRRAQEQGKTIVELESADYQLSLYSKLNDSEQATYLKETLEIMNNEEMLRITHALVNAWLKADSKAMRQVLEESLDEDTVTAEFTKKILLDQRNPEMTDKIEAMLKNHQSVFVGVGLLHLVGEKGIPALLQQRGYTVNKIY